MDAVSGERQVFTRASGVDLVEACGPYRASGPEQDVQDVARKFQVASVLHEDHVDEPGSGAQIGGLGVYHEPGEWRCAATPLRTRGGSGASGVGSARNSGEPIERG